MTHRHVWLDYQKVAQYAMNIEYFNKKLKDELDKASAFVNDDIVCDRENCSQRTYKDHE